MTLGSHRDGRSHSAHPPVPPLLGYEYTRERAERFTPVPDVANHRPTRHSKATLGGQAITQMFGRVHRCHISQRGNRPSW